MIRFTTLFFTLFYSFTALGNVQSNDLSGSYTGLTPKGTQCSVRVSSKEEEDSGKYLITFFNKNREIFHSSHDIESVHYYLEIDHEYNEEVIKDGLLYKKLYEVYIKSDEAGLRQFTVVRWRFLTGSGMATPFTKLKCLID